MIDPDTELHGIPVNLLDEEGHFVDPVRIAYKPGYDGERIFDNDAFMKVVPHEEVDRAVRLGEHFYSASIDEDFTMHFYEFEGKIYVSAQGPTDNGE